MTTHAEFTQKLFEAAGVVQQGGIYSVPLVTPEGRGVSYEKWTDFDRNLYVINRLSADYPSGDHAKVEPIKSLPVPRKDDGSFGTLPKRPPPYDAMSHDEFMKHHAAFQRECGEVIDQFMIQSVLQPALAQSILDRFPVFERAPLMPLFRAISPAFFAYLDASAARR